MIAVKLVEEVVAPPRRVSTPTPRAVHHLVYRRSWDEAPVACGATRVEAADFLALAGTLAKVVLLISSGPAAFKPCPICQPDRASHYVICRDIDNGVLG